VTRIKLLLCLQDVKIRFLASFNSILIDYTLKYIILKTEFNMYFIWKFSPYRTVNTVSKDIIAVCSQKSTKHINALYRRSVDLKALYCEKLLLVLSCMSVRSSVCLYVRPHGTTGLPLEGFSWNLIFEYFSKTMTVPRWFLLRMGKVPDKGCR
jgi:hypothetical protein